MNAAKDWLPRRNHDVLAMAKKWALVLPERCAAWEVTVAEITELNALIFSVEDARRAAAASGGGTVAGAMVREAFGRLRPFMRVMKRRRFTSPPLANADLIALGLKPHDTKPSTESVPATIPVIAVILEAVRTLTFRIREAGSLSMGKPAGVHGIQFRWDIRSWDPTRIEELANVVIASSSPIVLSFDEAQRGQRVYFVARWVNSTLSGGPWSEIGNAIIP